MDDHNNLKPTISTFDVVGKVVDLTSKAKNNYIVQSIILKTSQHSIFKCELIGAKENNVKMFLRNNDYRYYSDVFHIPYSDYRKKLREYTVFGAIKLSFHRGSRLQEYVPYDAIEMINEHLSVGDVVKIRGNLQFSRSDDKSNEDVYENFHLRQIIKLDNESFQLPKFAEDSIVSIDADIIFSQLKEDYKFEAIFVYKKNGIVYTVKTILDYDKSLDQYFKGFQFGQLLKLHGRFDYYVELVEVENRIYFKNNIIKKFTILGGELTETTYDSSLFDEKAADAFNIENNSSEIEYDF